MDFQTGNYNIYLIAFSICLAVAASTAAVDLFLQKRTPPLFFRRLFLVSSATVLGLGTWCMHFVGALAYRPLQQMQLDPAFVCGALLLSLAGSFLSLFVLKQKDGKHRFLSASLLLSLSMVAIHTVGMQAFRPVSGFSYQLPFDITAGLVGFAGAYFAFRGMDVTQHQGQGQSQSPFSLSRKLRSGIFMGLSICGSHYIQLNAVSSVIPPDQLMEGSAVPASVDMTLLAAGVGLMTLLILSLVFIGSRAEEKLASQSRRIRMGEQQYDSLYHHHPDLIVTFDLNGTMIHVNNAVEAYGYTVEEVLGQSFTSYVVPDQLEKTLRHFHHAVQGKASTYETALWSKEGRRIELQVTQVPIQADHETAGVYGIIKDITRLKRTQEALVEAEFKYRSLVEESQIGIYIIQDGRFVYVNPQFIAMSGYTSEELNGSAFSEYIHLEDLSLVDENSHKGLRNESQGVRYQCRGIKKDQSTLYLEIHASNTVFRGRPAVIGSAVDITEQKVAEAQIEQLAFHDALTGLANRNRFMQQFQSTVSDQTLLQAAVLFLDLDRFKGVNDTMGYELGNLLLKNVAERLKACIRPEDCLARLGGDEFILLLPEPESQDILQTAQSISSRFTQPFFINGYEIYITPSMGISRYPKDGTDLETLVKKADMALHQVKRSGKNGFQVYSDEDCERMNQKFEMEMDLHKALERGEFVLYYQPKLNTLSGQIIGLEALIRWQHPEKGLIPPDQFIPLAEETGLIIPMGEWVLRKACAQNRELQEKGLLTAPVSVNLSPRQFFQTHFIPMVRRVLQDTGLAPELLELEITETMMMDSHHALDMVKELKALGMKISLDDFGKGYSSLHYLKEFPVDKIKIDQSFIRHCLSDASNATLVKTIIAMAHQLDKEVVAEGVETREHLVFLQQNRCHEVQGYLFSKPLPLAELADRFQEIGQLADQLKPAQQMSGRQMSGPSGPVTDPTDLMTAKLITDHSQDLIKLTDAKGCILYASPSHQYILGFAPEEYTGQHILEHIHPEDTRAFMEQLRSCIHNNQPFSMELRLKNSQGQWIWVESFGTVVLDEQGQFKHVVFTTRNIMERRQYEARLKHLAFHDPLTDLPNRRSFKLALEKKVQEVQGREQKLAVLFMDLDKFKQINDHLGHDAGDELLRQFAHRLGSCLPDTAVIARLGGDEFTILLPDISDEADAALAAERITEALQPPWRIGEHTVRTTSSIGISVYPRDGWEPAQLLRCADQALYCAKEKGRNNYQFFQPQIKGRHFTA